ncbi:MAG: hypothetical protein AAF727_08020 [Pseudomonadota bacterium]
MKHMLMIAACALSLAACQTTTTTPSAPAPAPSAQSTPAIQLAVAACVGYVETGTFDAAPLTRAGFKTGRSVTGPNYRLAIGNTTLDRVNARSVTVGPRRAPGCALTINGAGGTFAETTNTINQRIIQAGWTYAPQGRTRSYTKGTQRMDMTGSSYNGLKTFGLSRK